MSGVTTDCDCSEGWNVLGEQGVDSLWQRPPVVLRVDSNCLVAQHHIAAHPLKAQGGVGKQGDAPKLPVVFAQVVREGNSPGALDCCNGVGSPRRRMGPVQEGGFSFHVADVRLARPPVLRRKQRSVGVGKGAGGRDRRQCEEFLVKDSCRFGGFGDRFYRGNDRYRHERVLNVSRGAGSIGKVLGRCKDSSGHKQDGEVGNQLQVTPLGEISSGQVRAFCRPM